MEYTPEPPHSVPPSEDVRQAEMMAQHKRRVRRAKMKLYATWWTVGFLLYASLSVLYMIEVYWLMPLAFTTGIYLMVSSNLWGADRTYRNGVEVGLALGSMAALQAYQHAMMHVAEGTEPCEGATKLTATIPHVWEDHLAREEIRISVDDDDPEGEELDRMFNDPPRS